MKKIKNVKIWWKCEETINYSGSQSSETDSVICSVSDNLHKTDYAFHNVTLGFNFLEIKSKVETFPKKRVNIYFEIKRGEKTKISKINFKGDRKIRDRRLRDIITSQEDKFWKVLTILMIQ